MRLTLPLILAFFGATQLQAYQPIRVMLGKPDENKERAFIDIHMPTEPNGMSVIICPGGGYGNVVAGPEGNRIAVWLREHGITGVVLHYRLPRGRHHIPLSDAQAAYTYMREHASGLKLDAKRIGVMGFSAGGHLARSEPEDRARAEDGHQRDRAVPTTACHRAMAVHTVDHPAR